MGNNHRWPRQRRHEITHAGLECIKTFATRGGPGGGAFFYQSRTVYPGGSRPGQPGPGSGSANDPAGRPGPDERRGVTIEGEADEPDEPRR